MFVALQQARELTKPEQHPNKGDIARWLLLNQGNGSKMQQLITSDLTARRTYRFIMDSRRIAKLPHQAAADNGVQVGWHGEELNISFIQSRGRADQTYVIIEFSPHTEIDTTKAVTLVIEPLDESLPPHKLVLPIPDEGRSQILLSDTEPALIALRNAQHHQVTVIQ